MKLCIIKPDGSMAETSFTTVQPSLDRVNSELLLFENYLYKLIIHFEETVENAELFVGDYSVPLLYNENKDCFETEKELVFGGCFDLAYVSVNIDDGNGNEKVYYTDYLRIATTKQTSKQIDKMLEEIENSLPNFLEVCFSRSRKKSGLIKNDVRSIWNTLKIIDDIITIYDENCGYFSNHKKSSVEQIPAIVDVKSMHKINQDSLIWIASNPDNLISSHKQDGINVNEKKYIPAKVKTQISRYSYNVYENKVVLGFLNSVIKYIEDQLVGFEREMLELESIPESIVTQLPNTHELTGRCIFIYYKGVVEKFLQKRNLLQEIYNKYVRILECEPELVYNTPKLTNTFKQVYHYRLCYECMVKWYEAGDYSLDYLNYLFKLKTLSRIFEYYCLIKMQSALSKCGYSFIESERIVYDLENDNEEINNKYVFSGRGQEVTLLYEPTIWTSKMNQSINLYSTGYNFSKGKWNDCWTPDFVIKISTGIKEYYYILDAKYSNEQNVKKRYMPELVLKYSAQIASKNKSFSDVIGVGAIYPGDIDKISYFKRNGVGSSKESLPNYFSLTVVGSEDGSESLKERLMELLMVIDDLETESRPNVNSIERKEEKDETYIIHNVLEKKISGDEVKVIATSPVKQDTNITSIVASQENKVHGKKCFFYARGMCLCKKTRCTIDNDTCDEYVFNKDRELLKEEDECRNFIRYTRKGKVNRVECAVFNIPGCIGVKECKFCLRKRKK